MDLFVDPSRPRQVARALYDQIRGAISSGRLTGGERLPPSRDLAEQLGVSRQTITTVYSRLTAEGHAIGRGSAGTYVVDDAVPPPSTSGVRPNPSPLAARCDLPSLDGADGTVVGSTARFDLRSGTPDLALFPVRAWQRATSAVLHEAPGGYGNPTGRDELRRALARHVATHRGVIADPRQIVVTSGAQPAIDLILRLLTRPGDVVAIEEPGYPPVRDLIEALGRVAVPIPVDRDGIRPDLIPQRARVVYTTPSHQSPTGATLSLARRRSLLDRAAEHDQAIIEDDYDSEHRHVDRPLEPLHLLDRQGRVIYVATFSKTMSPGLRLGYTVLPESLVAAAGALRRITDVQPPDIVQRAMHRFIVDGDLDRHLRRTRRIYAERHRIARGLLARCAADGLLVPLADDHAGLHVAARLTRTTEADLAARLAPHEIVLGSYRSCWMAPPDHEGIVIGFGNIATADLVDALEHVGAALRRP